MLRALNGNIDEPCALLLGGFDGFHAGHRTLLSRAKETGLPVALTSIAGGKAGGDVFTFPEREEIFAREGFAFVEEIFFTEEFQSTSAEEFLRGLFGKISVKEVFCGADFRFGRGALGNIGTLQKFAPCPVHALPLKEQGGGKIAVAKIKELLSAGRISDANALLGYGYFIKGEVLRGRQVGRTLGFPTVNLCPGKEKLRIREGVYGGRVETPQGDYRAIINAGARPTFGVEEYAIEAHLVGFQGDLYGEEVRVYPEAFLRPVQAFSSRAELIAQLQKDILTELRHD